MRLLRNPRVYIYLCGIILTVFFLKWNEREVRRRAQQASAAQQTVPQPARTPLAPVVKDAELSTPQALPGPKLYIFGEMPELDVKLLREQLQGKCSVLQVQGGEEMLKKAFELEALPVAILYTRNNQELARFLPPLELTALQQKTLNVLETRETSQ